MKERIRELASGQVEVNMPKIKVQPESLNDKLNIDGLHRADILIQSENQVSVKGVAYSSHSRVQIAHPTFCGRRCSISLEINTVGLSGQGIIEGVVTLVTNAGQFEIPYSFSMKERGYGADERQIRTLDDFADFALEDEKGAINLFRSRQFMHLPFMRDLQRSALYQALQSERDDRRNLEEFLVYTHAKEGLEYTFLTDSVIINDGDYGIHSIDIEKNTWGYGVINITADKPFINLAANHVITDSFCESQPPKGTYTLGFSINSQHLSPGENTALITLKSSACMRQVTVKVCVEERLAQPVKVSSKRFVSELAGKYIKYRAMEMEQEGSGKTVLKQLVTMLKAEIKKNPEDWEKKLYLIYFSLLGGQTGDADRYLDEVREDVMKNRMSNVKAYCFFLYLRALFNDNTEQMDTAAKLITKYYTENGHVWELVLLLIRADSAYSQNQSLCVLRLKELYMEGYNSPFMYLDACECYRKCPDLLRVLNDFEQKVMSFGARKGVLSHDLALTAAKVSSFENSFKPFTYSLLSNIYKKFPEKEVLENICAYLIRCGMRSEEYFSWFELGVKEELTVVGLNEAYVSALPRMRDKPLPQAVLLYFAYSQELRDDVREILYENILLHYKKDCQIYKEYAQQMEEYALTQLLAGRISKKLVPLYRTLIYQEMIDKRLAAVLPELLMCYEISVEDSGMTRVIISSPELSYEDTYSLENGICLAPVYTDDSLIMFVDGYQNRHSDVPYKKELLFSQPELLAKCEEVYPDHLIFKVKRCMNVLEDGIKKEEDLKLLGELLDSADISAILKNKLASKLLDYYFSKNMALPDDFEKKLDISSLQYHDRREALECLVMAQKFSEVYEYISQNSVNGLKFESLLKLCDFKVKDIKGAYEQYLLDLCFYLFNKRVYSPYTLTYICKYYNGPDEQMKRILFFGAKNQIPLEDMAERLLAQMLFVGDMDGIKEVYDVYLGYEDVKESVQRAYTVMCCYQYFVNDKLLDSDVFLSIAHILFGKDTKDLLRTEYEENDIINIAFLYYLTKNENVLPGQNDMCECLLNRLCKKGLLFGFYSLLWDLVRFPSELNGKFLLEYRSHTAKRVLLTMKKSGCEPSLTVQMQKMYDGIFVSQVVLFADETLEYSICEDADGKITTVVEKELVANDMAFVRSRSTFDSINELGRLLASRQDNLLEDALIKYETRQYVCRELFKPL